MKICNKCKIEKDESCFFKLKSSSDGFGVVCKDCFRAYYKRVVKNRFSTIYGDTKKCNVCGELLPISYFYMTKKTGYVQSTCKKCRSSINHKKRIRKLPIIDNCGNKICRICGKSKSNINFYKRRCVCNDCQKADIRYKKYGITQDEFSRMLINQDNKCVICGDVYPIEESKLCVDHCHKTNKIRGLLCNHCNIALGNFKDDVQLLKNAIKYLRKHQK